MTDRPRLPNRKNRVTSADRDSATWLALFALVSVGGGLAGLMTMVLPQIGWLLIGAVGFTAFFALQYLVWGRWMQRYLQETDGEEAIDPATYPQPPLPPADFDADD